MADPRFDAVSSPTFQPARRPILSITQTNPLVVTTTFDGTTAGDNNYQTGLIVRLEVPFTYGMSQVNNVISSITYISDSSFSMDGVDGTNFDPFVIPSLTPMNTGFVAQVIPVGEVYDSLSQATRNVLTPLS